MSQKPVIMSQIKQVQQLKADGISIREIARRTGVSRKTVKKYLRQLESLPEHPEGKKQAKISEKQLAAIVYNNDGSPVCDERLETLIAHFDAASKDLSQTGVTKMCLWKEYFGENTDGYRYSQYCYWLKKYLNDTDPAFHWEYHPGEFTQVDFTGSKLSYLNKETEEIVPCEAFVGILPYSGLVFCLAVLSQRTGDFVTCINEEAKYFGGVTLTILVDNVKTAVKRSDNYEPVFTDMCYQLSDYYNTTFSATRPYSPRDKGMIEKTVNIVYQQIFAPLRKMTFYSLESLNRQIRIQLDLLNLKPYKNSNESRRDIFIRAEQALLKPLPEAPFELKNCREWTVRRDYAIVLPDNGHSYTVPYQYIGRKVLVYYNRHIVEVYLDHERIALHVRRSTEPKFNFIEAHMPPNHKAMIEMGGWTEEGFLKRAAAIGEYTEQIASRILHRTAYPVQHFKACNGMLVQEINYGKDRLEAACRRASVVAYPSLKLIKNILKAGLDKQPLLFDEPDKPLPDHDNIRGKDYYQ